LGPFIEHLVGTSKAKGLRTPSQLNPTPYKQTIIQHNTKGAQSVSGFVPLNDKKRNQKCGIWGVVGLGEKKKWKWGNGAGGGAVVAQWRCGVMEEGGWRWNGGWVGLGVMEMREKVGQVCTAQKKMRGRRGK
jgi:hypothetical protein